MPYKFNVFTGTFDLVNDPGLVTVEAVAATALSGHRVVRPVGDGTVGYADKDTPAHRDGPFWLTVTAALAGEMVQLVGLGLVLGGPWAWTAPGIIFLGINGQMTQTPPATGLSIQVAAADTPTSLYFDPEASISLAS